jgi:hypothetical protein
MDMNTTVKKMVEVEEPLVTEWSVVDDGTTVSIMCNDYTIFNVHASGYFSRICSVNDARTGLQVDDNGRIMERK